MGWTYGTPDRARREQLRQHWDMIPDWTGEKVPEDEAEKNYRRLNPEEQAKDTEPMECMLAMLRMFDGLRIYRLKRAAEKGEKNHDRAGWTGISEEKRNQEQVL